MGKVFLPLANLPDFLLFASEREKEVLVDPANNEPHAVFLQHFQKGDQKHIPDQRQR